jgi:SPP1 family predicted phage head-tail adaptor
MSGHGSLDRRILLERSIVTMNQFNEPIETWQTLAAVSGGKRDVSATESYRAQQIGAELTTRFRVRWSPRLADLNPRDRLVIAGLTYNIIAVREVDRERWLEIDGVRRTEVEPMVTSP